jgi:hypothetical protein
LNKKWGYVSCTIFLLLIIFYVYVRPVYLCENDNGIAKCGGREWNWDKKVCEEKLSCITIGLEKENE